MRGYFATVIRFISKAVPSPSAFRTFVLRHRALVFIMASGLLVVTTTALLATKHYSIMPNSSAHEQLITQDGAEGKHLAPGAHVSSDITTIIPQSGEPMRTNIIVNGKSVEMPENGKLHKTIQSENGNTTDVSISVDGNSTSSTISSSSSSVQIKTPSGIYSQSDGE